MGSSTTVRIVDLRAGLSAILDEVEGRFGEQVDLGADYYWTLRPAVAVDMNSDPRPDVGQLSDDIASLRELLQRRANGELFIWHDLAHVIGILKGIAALDTPGRASA